MTSLLLVAMLLFCHRICIYWLWNGNISVGVCVHVRERACLYCACLDAFVRVRCLRVHCPSWCVLACVRECVHLCVYMLVSYEGMSIFTYISIMNTSFWLLCKRLNSSTRVLLRIAHLFAIDEDAVWSMPASIDISLFFPGKYNCTCHTCATTRKHSLTLAYIWLMLCRQTSP